MTIASFKQIFALSLVIAVTEFKLKNEGSYLGIFWYLLNPLLTFLLLLAIFATRLGEGIPHYPLYLLLGIIVFNFFQQTTTESTKIIHQNNNIIKSINFPQESLIGAVILKNLFSHILEIILFLIISLFLKAPITGILFYPWVLLIFSLFCFGVSLALSALTVHFVDLENIWAFIWRLMWFGTPIFYTIAGQTRLFLLNLLNPLYYFITITRDLVIYAKTPESWLLLAACCYSLLALIVGFSVFSRLKSKFAELI